MATTVTIDTMTAPLLAGGFVSAGCSYTGTVGRISQHSVEWTADLPDGQTEVFARPWLVPLYAGTVYSPNANLETDATGRNFGAWVDRPGTFAVSALVRDAEGTVSTAAEQTLSVGGYDQYTTIHVDIDSTATDGVPYEDAFDDASGVDPRDRPLDRDTFAYGWQSVYEWDTTGTGYVVPVAGDGALRSNLTLDAYTTEVEVQVTLNLASSTGTLHGIHFRGTGSIFDGLWAGINPSSNQVELRSNAARTVVISSAAFVDSTNTDYVLRVYSDGSICRVYVDDVLYIDTTLSDFATNTHVGIQRFAGTASNVRFKNFSVTLPSSGDGGSEAQAISDIDMASKISNRALDKVRFLVYPGEYTPTSSLFCAGSNVLWQAQDYTNKPVIETASNSGNAFVLGRTSVTSERCAVSGFIAKFTGGDGTSGTPFYLSSNNGPIKACGFDRCSMFGSAIQFRSGPFGNFIDTSADQSAFLTRFGEDSAPTTEDHSCVSFGGGTNFRFFSYGGSYGQSTVERPHRSTVASQTLLWNKFEQRGIKNSCRFASCVEAEITGNAFLGNRAAFGGNDGTPSHVRMTRNYLSSVEFLDVSDDLESLKEDYLLAANYFDGDEYVTDDSQTTMINFSASYNDVVIAHNTCVVDTLRNDVDSFVARAGRNVYTTYGLHTFANNIFAYKDGGTSTRDKGFGITDAKSAPDNISFAGNVFLTAAQTSGQPTWAFSIGSTNYTEAQLGSVLDSTGDIFDNPSISANGVPSGTYNRTITDGVHRDFFGRLVVPGDTAWAGAVMSALPTPPPPGPSTPSAATSAHLIMNRQRVAQRRRLESQANPKP